MSGVYSKVDPASFAATFLDVKGFDPFPVDKVFTMDFARERNPVNMVLRR